MFVIIHCNWYVRFLIFGGVLRMKVYSIKTFGEIPLPYAKRISLTVFLSVLVLSLRISLMEDGHVDIE